MTPSAAYGVLDGVFQQALLGLLSRGDEALADIVDQVHALMPLMLTAWEVGADARACAIAFGMRRAKEGTSVRTKVLVRCSELR